MRRILCRRPVIGLGMCILILRFCFMVLGEIDNADERQDNLQHMKIVWPTPLVGQEGYEKILSATDEYIFSYRYEESKDVELLEDKCNVKIFEGEYALYSEKKDYICIKINEDKSSGSITINNVEESVNIGNIGNIDKVSIVDIDSEDSCKELVLHDSGKGEELEFIVLRCSSEIANSLIYYSRERQQVQMLN